MTPQIRGQLDEFGMSPEDWRWMRWEADQEMLRWRWRAFRALWCKPVVDHVRYDGVTIFRDNRDDDWTCWGALQATIGVLLDRHWTDRAEARWRRRLGRGSYGLQLAYWDSRCIYGGYDVMCIWLYPGCRVSIFGDGETNL